MAVRKLVQWAGWFAATMLVLAAPFALRGAEPAKSLRFYLVGSSVTDTVNYNALAYLAADDRRQPF